MYSSAKCNAKRLNLPFDLLLDDIVIPDICPYLKTQLTTTQGQGRVATNASIDRIDPKLGYIKGNIQIISELANRMKQNATEEQLIQFAKSILEVHETSSLN